MNRLVSARRFRFVQDLDDRNKEDADNKTAKIELIQLEIKHKNDRAFININIKFLH